jgi:hypothetical protein
MEYEQALIIGKRRRADASSASLPPNASSAIEAGSVTPSPWLSPGLMRESHRPGGRKGFSMKARHSAEQIVGKLRQAEVELGKGLKVPEVCRALGISEQALRCVAFGTQGPPCGIPRSR